MTPWPHHNLFPVVDMALAVLAALWPITEPLISRWWVGIDRIPANG